MVKHTPEDNGKAVLLLGIIIFIGGGYLVAWFVKQKILFYQNLFWITFWLCLVSLIISIGFFIQFLRKRNVNDPYDQFRNTFDKSDLGLISLASFIIFIISLAMMINAHQEGFSNEATLRLVDAQGKLDEFNYIMAVLTGVEIERLVIEGFDEAMNDICKSNNHNCEQLKENYQGVEKILEAKERADKILRFMKIAKK